MPNLNLPRITDAPGTSGNNGTESCTAEVVLKYKTAKKIFRPGQPIDNIVGRMTITEIDDDLLRLKPVPPPKPEPPPVVGSAGVQIGPLDPRGQFVEEYYIKCGLETIGPGQITVAGIRHYSTLEGLIDVLLIRSEPHQVIVNHGSQKKGLIIPFAKGSPFDGTGNVVGELALLAAQDEEGHLSDFGVADVANKMGVTQTTAIRIVRKLVELRKKKFIFHFRACNIGKNVGMVRDYKDAFGARAITFHACRLLFLPFILDQMNPGRKVSQFSSDKNTAKARLRTFDDPIGLLSPMMLAIVDIDGHTHVTQESLIEHRSPDQILGWAIFLLRQWRDAAPNKFVVPIMWENTELTFYCPLEVGWRQKLIVVV
jgi:hypothetical protein